MGFITDTVKETLYVRPSVNDFKFCKDKTYSEDNAS